MQAQVLQLQAENHALRTLLAQNNIQIPPSLVPAATPGAAAVKPAWQQLGAQFLQAAQPLAQAGLQAGLQAGSAALTADPGKRQSAALQAGFGSVLQQVQPQAPSMLSPVPQYYRAQ
jgi:hypothetical protein